MTKPSASHKSDSLGSRLLRAGDRVFCKLMLSGKHLGEGIVTRSQKHPSDPVTICRLDATSVRSRVVTTSKDEVELLSE